MQRLFRVGAELKGRSRTFFEMAPLPSGDSGVSVFLPSVGPDGTFKFDVAVRAGERIAIDPVVAIGYDYQIGAGDLKFNSVLLPAIGDGKFDLYLFNGTDYTFQSMVTAGSEYFFAAGGVDRFRILGIETDVGLDPSDPTAFITTLTFTSDGRFTGTMTPQTLSVTVAVPEPQTYMLLLAGLLGVGFAHRRRQRTY